MFCKNCGKELPESAKFCNSCGTPVAPAPEEPEGQHPAEDAAPAPESAPVTEEPAVTAGESTQTAADGAAAGTEAAGTETSGTETSGAEAAGAAGVAGAVKRRGKSGLFLLIAGVVVVVLVIVLLVKLLGGAIGGGGGRTQAFAYLNDDYELLYLSDLKEKTEALEITDEADYGADVQFSPNAKTLYFLDGDSTLYTIPVSELKDNGRPDRIARDVETFWVLDTGNVVYLEYDGEYEASMYDGEESYTLAKNFYNWRISDDDKTFYYVERDPDDGIMTLFSVPISKDGENQEKELLDGATDIYTSYDADLLVYAEDDYDPDAAYTEDYDFNTMTVYSCKPGEEPTELVRDVYDITDVKVDGGKVSFYYYIQENEKRTLYDFVTDSMAAQDAQILAEELEYPAFDDFYPDEAYFDGTSWYYTTYSGETFPLSAEQIAEYVPDVPLSELDEYTAWNVAYEVAEASYDAAYEEYNTKYDEWYAASDRQYIREALQETEYGQSVYSLYHYTGSADSEPIATDINPSQLVTSNGVFLYQKNTEAGGKVADVADLDYYSDIYDLLETGSAEGAVWYQNVGDTESPFEFDDEETTVARMCVLNDKEVVLYVHEGGQSALLSYSLGANALTFTDTILDDDFAGLTQSEDTKGNDVLYLFTDVDGESYGDFSCYANGELTVVAKEVLGAIVLDESGTTYVVTDLSSSAAELSLVDGGDLVTVSDELTSDPVFLEDKQLLYVCDGDLYVWDGKEERRVARDVEAFWAAVELSYNTYSPY